MNKKPEDESVSLEFRKEKWQDGYIDGEKPILPTPKKVDMVNHPPHYTRGKYEVIDVLDDWNLPPHLWNAVKYIARCEYKGKTIEDLEKAIYYINRFIKKEKERACAQSDSEESSKANEVESNVIPDWPVLNTHGPYNISGRIYEEVGFGQFGETLLYKQPPVYIKNTHLSRVPQYINGLTNGASHFIHFIIQKMTREMNERREHQYVDIKIQKLKVGERTCNGLWHLDSDLNGQGDFENLLFQYAETNVGSIPEFPAYTEFLSNEFQIPRVASGGEFHEKVSSLPLTIEPVRGNVIYKYNGLNVHRGPVVREDQTRLLIRLVNTDRRLPQGTRITDG